MRPIGGIFFGALGDKFGRKAALSASVICMSFPTMLIGALPTYENIGFSATVLMIIARMLQGLSMGGALTGSISFIIEHTPKERRGLAGSIPMAGICVGILLSSLVSYIVKNSLSAEQFDIWGWRLPFLFGIVILLSGFYIKNCTKETPMFEELKAKGDLSGSPLSDVINSHWKDMIISILINSTGSVIFYLQAIYLMTFLKQNRKFMEDDVSLLINMCYVIMFFTTLFMGYLSDRIGRKRIFVLNLVCIICLVPFLITIFENGDFAAVTYALIALSILAATYIGPEPALQAEFYPTAIRSSALSISYNTATSLFGGTTPYVLGALVLRTGSFTSCIYYVVVCAFLSLVSLYFYKKREL
jgi:MHS family proline/betaine transporter-like MFS transporter